MMPAIERTRLWTAGRRTTKRCWRCRVRHFARERVDAAVIEVGVGGRLDGTNVIRPTVSVITNVGLDHTEILGETMEAIAADKAGIAKPGVPLVSDVGHAGARAMIEALAARSARRSCAVADVARVEPRPGGRYGQAFDVDDAARDLRRSRCRCSARSSAERRDGDRALERAARRPAPTPRRRAAGFARLVIPGRMEFFAAHPAVVFDIAHNPEKAQRLADALREAFPGAASRSSSRSARAKTRGVLERCVRAAGRLVTSRRSTPPAATRPGRSGLAGIAETHGTWARVGRRSRRGAFDRAPHGRPRRSRRRDAARRSWWRRCASGGSSKSYCAAPALRDRGALDVRGARFVVGRAHVPDGHRQRDARFVLRRRLVPTRARRRRTRSRSGRPAPICSTSARESTRPGHAADRRSRRSAARFCRSSPRSRERRRRDRLDRYVQTGDLPRRARCGRRHAQLGVGPRPAARGGGGGVRLPVVVMHNKRVAVYERDVVDEVLAFLEDRAAVAVRAASRPSASSSTRGSASARCPSTISRCSRALDRVTALGFPTLLGTSRKSTIGKLTGRGVAERAVRDGRDRRAGGRGGHRHRARPRRRRDARRRSRRGCDRARLASAGLERRTPVSDAARIFVRDIRAYGRHGANPGERDAAQPFDLDVELVADVDLRARTSDDLADTIDYAAIHAGSSRSSRPRRTRCSNDWPTRSSPTFCATSGSRRPG